MPGTRKSTASAAVILGLLVHVALNVQYLAYPTLHAEDGSILLARYYHADGLRLLCAPYAGYVSLIPNVLGWVACRLPTQWIPYSMAWIAVCIHAAALSVLALTASRGLSSRFRVACSMFLCAAPIGNYAVSCCLMYAQWSLLLILLCVCWDVGQRRLSITKVALVHGAVWSHPMGGLVVVVLCVRSVWMNGSFAGAWLWPLFSAVLYCICGLTANGMEGGVVLMDALDYVGVRCCVELVLSTGLKSAWYDIVYRPWVWGCVSVVGWILLVSSLRWRTSRRLESPMIASWAIGILGIALPVAAFVARHGVVSIDEEWGQRYVVCTRALLVCALCIGGYMAMSASARGRWCLAVVGVAYLLFMGRANAAYYRPQISDAAEVARFMRHLQDEEAHCGGSRNHVGGVLERGEWEIRIE